jgi:hypothetical protein
MLVETRLALIRNAAKAAQILDTQLILLLDLYDFCLERYDDTPTTSVMMRDVQASITALSVLPIKVANRLEDWATDRIPEESYSGFELHVLNEFSIHLFSLCTYLRWKEVDISDIDHPAIGAAFNTLKSANRLLS